MLAQQQFWLVSVHCCAGVKWVGGICLTECGMGGVGGSGVRWCILTCVGEREREWGPVDCAEALLGSCNGAAAVAVWCLYWCHTTCMPCMCSGGWCGMLQGAICWLCAPAVALCGTLWFLCFLSCGIQLSAACTSGELVDCSSVCCHAVRFAHTGGVHLRRRRLLIVSRRAPWLGCCWLSLLRVAICNLRLPYAAHMSVQSCSLAGRQSHTGLETSPRVWWRARQHRGTHCIVLATLVCFRSLERCWVGVSMCAVCICMHS